MALEGEPGLMFDNECPLRGMDTDAAVDGRAADPSVWLVRPGACGRRSSEQRGEVCERKLCTGSRPESGAGHASGRDEHLALHAPALTMALLLEGCCSRSASAAVSMAHVTLARVSAVWGRCASGAAVGGRSSDCCIAALMRAEGSYHSFKIERKSLSGCRSACIHNNSMGRKVANDLHNLP